VPDALSYTFDDLEGALPASYTDDRWRLIAEHLAEHLQNGLTQGLASSPSPKKATLPLRGLHLRMVRVLRPDAPLGAAPAGVRHAPPRRGERAEAGIGQVDLRLLRRSEREMSRAALDTGKLEKLLARPVDAILERVLRGG
jgi:hypothetical protein